MKKLLGINKKSKEQKKLEHQDALQRTYLVSSKNKQEVKEDKFGDNALEEYYAIREGNNQAPANTFHIAGGKLGQELILNNYKSVHAKNFESGKQKNFDEDDVSAGEEESMQFADFRRDMLNHFDLEKDEEGKEVQYRSQRSQAFNEEIDFEEFKVKVPPIHVDNLIEEGKEEDINFGPIQETRFQSEKVELVSSDLQPQIEIRKESVASDIRATEKVGDSDVRHIHKDDDEHDLYEEEKHDQVENLQDPIVNFEATRARHSSAVVYSSAETRGVSQDADLNKRISMISGGAVQNTHAKDDGIRQRAPSVIQLERQERLKKQIQREQESDKRRNTKWDDIARSQLMDIRAQERQEEEKDNENDLEIEEYRKELEKDDEEEMFKDHLENAIFEEQEQELRGDNFLSENSEEACDFLADFYKEMNTETDSSVLKNNDLSKDGSSGRSTSVTKATVSIPTFDFSKDTVDLIRFIDHNERRHQLEAQMYLKQNSFTKDKCDLKQHVLTNEQPLQEINESLTSLFNYNLSIATCVAMSEDLMFVGTSSGEVHMFDVESQQHFSTFIDKGKEFQNNSVTSLNVHPTKCDYVLVGYNGGQIALFDATDQNQNQSKSIKIIKDHHKGVAVINLQFCDLVSGTQHLNQLQKAQKQNEMQRTESINPYDLEQVIDQDKQKQYDAMNEWMFVSIDMDGKVIINHVFHQFMFNRVKKQIIIEPIIDESKFMSLSCRFRSLMHPAEFKLNDIVTLIAIGSLDKVLILAITPDSSQLLKEIMRPQYKTGHSQDLKDFKDCYPALQWGYGHSPALKDKCYATLAVAWGPLVQLYVLNNLADKRNQVFIEDGYTLMSNGLEFSLSKEPRQGSTDHSSEIFDQRRGSYLSVAQRTSTVTIKQSQFEMKDLHIKRIWFLAESILLVLTRSLEFKLLYTQKLDYGCYNPKTYLLDMYNKKLQQDEGKKIQVCVVDEGIILSNLTAAKGKDYSQTICAQNGHIVAVGTTGLVHFKHLGWDESLELFKEMTKGNWVQDFTRAIEIYTGQVKGFKDVPEDTEIRQEQMKGQLKLFIRTIIFEQLDKWNMEQDNSASEKVNLDDTNLDLIQQLEGQKRDVQKLRYNNLIRISIEFCVLIQDCYFLFYDLFLMFQEEQLEEIFLEELKPFILAGRFQNWELPGDILQNHIINYYKDPYKPEQIEKIILNLNLAECPDEELVNLIQFSEQNFLSTALVALHIAAFNRKDNTSCIHVILSLLDLYKQAKDNNPGSYEELKDISQHPQDSSERLRVEKSQFYLGYKILWVIRLFLNGKKFPQGNILQAQWRKQVHEIVDCITNKNVMLDLLYIDAEAYFQIISIVFYKGKVFDFIQEDKIQQEKVIKAQKQQVSNSIIDDELYKDLHQPLLSHNEILQRFEDVLITNSTKMKVPNEIRLQYIFFVTNVASKANIHKDNKFYLQCVKELLTQSTKFVQFNSTLIQRAQRKKHRNDERVHHGAEESKHLYVSETAIVELLHLCEPLDDAQVDELIQMTKSTRFNQLRVMLLEKKGEIVQCLQLFIEGMKLNAYAAQRKEAVNRIFDWINLKLDQFAAKKVGNNKVSTMKEDALRQQIVAEFSELVGIDAHQTFLLIDEKFNHEHEKFVQSLVTTGSTEQQFKYLETMLQTHHQKIQSCIEEYLMQGLNKEKAMTYMNLQNMHFRLLCQNFPDRVLERVRRIKKNEIHFNLDDCLQICEEFDIVEASAGFLKKIGNYFSSGIKFTRLLSESKFFNYAKLSKRLVKIGEAGVKIPHFVPFPNKDEKMRTKEIIRSRENPDFVWSPNCWFTQEMSDNYLLYRFDYILRKVIICCVKESTENFNEDTIQQTWFCMLDSIFQIKYKQLEILNKLKEEAITKVKQEGILLSDERLNMNIDEVNLRFDFIVLKLEEFFQSRIAYAVEQTLKHIELEEFLNHIVENDGEIMFKELKDMILLIFSETSNEYNVLKNATRSATEQGIASFQMMGIEVSHGLHFNYKRCLICKRFVDDISNIKRKAKVIQHYALDSDSDDYEQPFIDPFIDSITLYECGHPFHIKCVEKHIKDILTEKENSSKYSRKQKQIEVSQRMIEQQPCPHCFSEKFKIDFEGVFNRRNMIGKGATTTRKISGTEEEMLVKSTQKSDGLGDSQSSEDSMKMEFRKRSYMEERRQMRSTSIARFTKSEQEQKLSRFEFAFLNEGVTLNNFNQLK